MTWVSIRAGQDHLQQYAQKSAVDALTELIWNGLDAESDRIDVDIETGSLPGGGKETQFVTRVTVTDNGHGIDPDKAEGWFSSLGDSWKKGLNGRTVNNVRALHGSRGRGRFYAYSLGSRVTWSSVYRDGQKFYGVEISGTSSQINGFNVTTTEGVTGPARTRATIDVQQGNPLTALLRNDLHEELTARLATHLLGNPDIDIKVAGGKLDPHPLIEGEPVDQPLEVPPEEYVDREQPVMTIIDWAPTVRVPASLVLCTADGVSLIEVSKIPTHGNVKSTGYLRWSGWATTGADLLLAQMDHAPIIDAGRQALVNHLNQRVERLTVSIVETLVEENAYPYPDVIVDPVQETERQLFDLIAVTARTPLRASPPSQRKMTARLLQLALQERPESLDVILADALALSDAEREELADLLQYSSLGKIVGAAAEVTRRLDLIATLRHVIYTKNVARKMREVDQLHPLVKDNVWLFGEAWRLSASEAGLTNVLRAAVGEDLALESDLVRNGPHVLLPDGKRGRVDLLMQRCLVGPDNKKERLVVELKRPSIKLGAGQLQQVKNYAKALTVHPGSGPSKWSFWLVGADIKTDEIGDELEQEGREWGHVIARPKYDIRVATWGTLLEEADHRLLFYREQLAYDASQDEAVERVRRRHQEVLPDSL